MALLAGGGSAQLQRDPGTAGPVQGQQAFGSALAGVRLATALPFFTRFTAGDGQAQQPQSVGVNAPGVTLTATLSLLSGTATGAAAAPGVIVTNTASVIAGAASAGAAGNAAGVTLTATSSLIAGSATGAASAMGAVLTSALTLVPGSAAGGGLSSAQGAQVTVTASLMVGTASALFDRMDSGARTPNRVSAYLRRPRDRSSGRPTQQTNRRGRN
jgi:hypothetical protein